MKPSTENLILAIDLVFNAACEKRSDLPDELIQEIVKIRSKLQYLKEIDCD